VNHVVIKATDRTKLMADGITARVVRDIVTDQGAPVEVTNDWYAQDFCGNVWSSASTRAPTATASRTTMRPGRPADTGTCRASIAYHPGR
jgi:hypothetical protein